MAHYAFLDENNIVTQVIVGRDEDDLAPGVTSWEDYYSARHGQTCKRTSYNTYFGQHTSGGTPFRGNYAAIGYTYDETLDAFLPPQPFPSWTLNDSTFCYDPPVPEPEAIITETYSSHPEWDESSGSWVFPSGE